jgi:aspartate/methionine/tyrosine aminotransferase
VATTRDLLAAHHKLDDDCRNRSGRLFVSDWYCEHPFVGDVFPASARHGLTAEELLPYCFQNDDQTIHDEIGRFHESREGRRPRPDSIFVGAGLSPLITAQMLLLVRRGVKRVFYVRPLYYTYYFLAETLGIELTPVNSNPLVDSREQLRLPLAPNSWLLMADPVWYMGRNADGRSIDAIRHWQEVTGGMVIVDGAFQYQRWFENDGPERTSTLLVDQTIRNLCPTKTVATHGPRFAYSIVPADLCEELRYCYANTSGSGSVFDRAAGMSMMRWLNSRRSNDPLMDLIRRRHQQLTRFELLDDPIGARASYFCFVAVPVDASRLIVMDQRFFDTDCFPGLVRFNLLLPRSELVSYVRLAAHARGQDIDDALASVFA